MDVVESTLADNDIHLAADSAVAEQFLNIEQAASFAVDRVLRTARPEQRARSLLRCSRC